VKNLNLKNRSLALLIVGVLGLSSSKLQAQDVAGQISFGFDAGGNKYYGNYTDDQFAFQGMAFIRWNIMDWLSLHAAYNGGELKYKATTGSIANELPPFSPINTNGGTTGTLGTDNETRVGGWDLMLSANVFPSQTFVPYFIGGLEVLNFQPDDASPSPLNNNANDLYSKNVIGGVMGVGFEMFISPKVTFNGMGLLHLTGTDWIDDYSNPNDYRQDAYVTMGLGFSYYIFAPDAPVVPDVSGGTTTNNYNTNNYRTENNNIYHTDTLYIQNPTDTVYLVNPKINTIFNFPGTLFIVNTDQFNNTQPNNMSNLYHILSLVNQCPNLRVEIQGYASEEGGAQHNQDLSDRRAARIKGWLIDQGVSSDKIAGTIGYGDTRPAVRERSDVSASELEAERAQNRRIAVRVVQACQ
jgi:outer membrane protein OmpA-like peptidoglycan-associated protein